MDLIKNLQDYVGSRPEKFFKNTLFHSERLLLGLNCLEPGQVQTPHDHSDQDKFYYVVEGQGHFWLGDDQRVVGKGHVVLAPAGVAHGVKNEGSERLTLLVGIAPAP
ncbi:cupin domain-containing protein [Candidatus Leptofilum sp.]|uniref:cupin domain-containing protein n=1 Tax=Candidatus Leptofilum sp. TaxID=3241576 RepID=UPI003B5CC618